MSGLATCTSAWCCQNAEGVKAHGPYGSETFNDASAAADWLAERYNTIERPNEKALVPYDAERGNGAIWCNEDGEPARIVVDGQMVVLDDPNGVYIAA